MGGYWMKPDYKSDYDGGLLLFGPIQFNWGFGNGQIPKGLRVHLTWPLTRSLYLFE